MELNIEGKKRIFNYRRLIKHHYLILTFFVVFFLFFIIVGSMFYGVMYRAELNEFYDRFPQALDDIPNYFKGKLSRPREIFIDVAFLDYLKLKEKRDAALQKGILIKEEDDDVPATIRSGDKSVRVRLRLKGDWTIDHLTGKKWSFRINVRGDDTFWGMDEFSLQRPHSRNYVYEWFFHKVLKREGLIGLRYDFVKVIFNGEDLGIYALEEHFAKELLESNGRREGVIVKLDETSINKMRDEMRIYVSQNMDWFEEEVYFTSYVRPYGINKLMENEELYSQFIKAKNLLEAFRRGELKTREVFDIEKYAKLMALVDLTSGDHWHPYTNLRLYYNPITSKLEPIGFDASTGEKITGISYNPIKNKNFIRLLFEDLEFTERYFHELERLSQKKYLDDLLLEIDGELKHNLDIIYKETPSFDFEKEIFYQNQKLIRELLNPVGAVLGYVKEKDDKTILLDVANVQILPIEIIELDHKGKKLKPSSNVRIILDGKERGKIGSYEEIKFTIPEDVILSDDLNELRINYKIPGTSKVLSEEVLPWSYIDEDFLKDDFIRRESNLQEFDFFNLDEDKKIISMRVGDWEIDKDLIVPAGFILQMEGGTKLSLVNKAGILSYSPLLFIGDEEEPVIINSEGGKGILVINAKKESFLEYVIFDGLADPSREGLGLTGAITFYESPVYLKNSILVNGKSEDLLNIIKSKFKIEKSLIKSGNSDCLDVDFGVGVIVNSEFGDCSNDGVDFSGSIIELKGVNFNKTGDKAISVGEESNVKAEGITIENSNIGVANKDNSILELKNIIVKITKYGIASYQKKPEFGPSNTKIENIRFEEVQIPYFIEEGSVVSVDGKEVNEKRNRKELIAQNFDGVK